MMYPSTIPMTTMSRTGQGQVSRPTCVYEPFGSTTTMSSGFPQYGSVTSGGGTYPPHVPPVSNTSMYPQGSVPSYQQTSQDHYRTHMQQQAAGYSSFPMQKPMSSTVSGYNQNPRAAYGQTNVQPRFPNLSYQRQAAPSSSFYPRGPSSTIPNLPGHPVGVSTVPRPIPAAQAACTPPVFRPQNIAPMYEQSIHSMTNPNYNNNVNIPVNHKYSSVQQSIQPSPPPTGGQQNSWTLSKNTSQHSPQTGATAPPNNDYPSQNRQIPASSAYGPSLATAARPSLPAAAQTGAAYTIATPYHPRLCHVIKGPAGYPEYGFLFISMSDGPYVNQVKKDSAAESAGLKPDDKIIEVNGFNVEAETNDEVVQRMRGLPSEMKLLVADRDTLQWYAGRGIKINSSLPMVRHMATRRRLPGASMLYPIQSQHTSVSPPVHLPLAATAEPVPVQRPYIYGETGNRNPTRSEAEFTVPPSEPEVTEPDDRKLLGQWYLQPDSPKPDNPASAKNPETVPPENSGAHTGQNDVSTTAVETSTATVASEAVRPTHIVPGLQRPDSPSALIQARIFDIIKKGTPLTAFNDPVNGAPDGSRVNDNVNTSAGFPCIGSYVVNQSGLEKVTDLDNEERQTFITPPSQVSTSGEARQETSLQKEQPTSDNDTKEGIKLIHSDKDTVSTVKDNNTGNSEIIKPATERNVNEKDLTTDFLTSLNLASQLDIDKNVAMSSLQLNTTDNNNVPTAPRKPVPSTVVPGTSDSPVPNMSNATPNVPASRMTLEKVMNSSGAKDNSKKLKVKIPAPLKRVSGTASPSKKITMTWKKKMAAKAILADRALSPEGVPGPAEENVENGAPTEEDRQAKVQKKKRTSSEAELNEESHELPTSKRGRGRGGARARGREQRSRGQSPRPARGRGRGGRGSQTGRGRGGRGRPRGVKGSLKIIAPAQNMSWQDYLSTRITTQVLGDDMSQPTVEVDVDEVPATTSTDEINDTDELINNGNITDTISSDKVNNTSEERGNEVKETEEIVRTLEVHTVKAEALIKSTSTEEAVAGKPESPLVTEKTESFDSSEQSTELHINENLIRKTENYTLSWVSFHGCKILLITSADGDFLVMKELVFEVFRPRRPEKTHSSNHNRYRDLSKKLKIKHIYKTKEKRLDIMYKDIDTEIFDIVHQSLIDKRVLHKMQPRLGVLALEDALRLYHFITKIGKSQCIDIREHCVKPLDSQNYRQKKDEMDLKYPINFNEPSCKSSKVSCEGPKDSSVIHTIKRSPKNVELKSAPTAIEVIDLVSSDDDSCQSDATLPYVDGEAATDIVHRLVSNEIEMKSPGDRGQNSASGSLLNENNVRSLTNTEPVLETVVNKDDQSSLTNTESTFIQTTSAVQNVVNEEINTTVYAEPTLLVAPQCLSTILLMDSMTKSNVVENSPQKAAVSVVLNSENPPDVPVSQPDESVIVIEETSQSSVSELVTAESSEKLKDITEDVSTLSVKEKTESADMVTECTVNDKTNQDEKSSEEQKIAELPGASNSFESRFKSVKGFFDVMYDDNYDEVEDDDDLTIIDLDGNEELLFEEGEKRVDELLEKRIKATTDEEIDQVWAQALRFQRPMDQLKKAILDGYEKQKLMQEQDEELEQLKRENEELRRFVDQHKEYLDPMPECDRVPGSKEADDAGEGDKS